MDVLRRNSFIERVKKRWAKLEKGERKLKKTKKRIVDTMSCVNLEGEIETSTDQGCGAKNRLTASPKPSASSG